MLRLTQTAVTIALYVTFLLSPSFSASRITTNDGNTLVGEIERLQDGIYSVRTPYGTVRIPSRAVRRIESIEGSGTGDMGAAHRRTGILRFAGSNTIGAALVPELLKQYAKVGGAIARATRRRRGLVTACSDRGRRLQSRRRKPRLGDRGHCLGRRTRRCRNDVAPDQGGGGQRWRRPDSGRSTRPAKNT